MNDEELEEHFLKMEKELFEQEVTSKSLPGMLMATGFS